MNTSARFLSVAFVGSLLAACGATVATIDDTDSGSSPRDSATPATETSVHPTPAPDAAVTPADVISMPPVQDAGTPVLPPPDSAVITPPPMDAGTVMPPRPDAGPPFPIATDGAVIYPTDAGYTPGTAVCGTMTCDSTTQECCVNTMTRTGSCVAHGTCTSVALSCDGPEDCPSTETCCLTALSAMGHVACLPRAMCATVPVVGMLSACHTNLDCTGRTTCCDLSGLGGGGFMIPAGLPKVCSPFCPRP